MLNRFFSCLLTSLTAGTLFLGAVPQPTEYEPTEIVETKKIEPNAVLIAKESVKATRHWDEDVSDNTIQITYHDAQLLMALAQAEGGNQGRIGMQRIMEVVLNRVESDEFPDSIQEVIYQPGQFETVTKGIIYTVEISPECHEALAEVEKNLKRDKSIIGFETSVNSRSLEEYFDYIYTVQDHDFYILKKD